MASSTGSRVGRRRTPSTPTGSISSHVTAGRYAAAKYRFRQAPRASTCERSFSKRDGSVKNGRRPLLAREPGLGPIGDIASRREARVPIGDTPDFDRRDGVRARRGVEVHRAMRANTPLLTASPEPTPCERTAPRRPPNASGHARRSSPPCRFGRRSRCPDRCRNRSRLAHRHGRVRDRSRLRKRDDHGLARRSACRFRRGQAVRRRPPCREACPRGLSP